MEREILQAPEGMIYTDGAIYGTTIYLAEGKSKDDFALITQEEYQENLEKQEQYI